MSKDAKDEVHYVDESGGPDQGDVFTMCGLMVDAYKLRKKTQDFDELLKGMFAGLPLWAIAEKESVTSSTQLRRTQNGSSSSHQPLRSVWITTPHHQLDAYTMTPVRPRIAEPTATTAANPRSPTPQNGMGSQLDWPEVAGANTQKLRPTHGGTRPT